MTLPQADAAMLVERAELERPVQELYRSIAGAIPATAYARELDAAGFTITSTRPNDYRFLTDRALDACQTYGVGSLSIAATGQGDSTCT